MGTVATVAGSVYLAKSGKLNTLVERFRDSKLKASLGGVKERVSNKIKDSEVLSNGLDFASNAGKKVKDKAREVGKTVGETATKLKDNVKASKLGEKFEATKNSGKDLLGKIRDRIASFKPQAKNVV